MPQAMKADLRRRIVDLAKGGLAPTAIVASLRGQVAHAQVYQVLRRERMSGAAIPRFPTHAPVTGELYRCSVRIGDADLLAAIDQACARRRWPRQILIRRLVEASATMIDAVLDDG